jgi:hypothetical protein
LCGFSYKLLPVINYQRRPRRPWRGAGCKWAKKLRLTGLFTHASYAGDAAWRPGYAEPWVRNRSRPTAFVRFFSATFWTAAMLRRGSFPGQGYKTNLLALMAGLRGIRRYRFIGNGCMIKEWRGKGVMRKFFEINWESS